MDQTCAPIIQPRSELNLHRTPPTRPLRGQTWSNLQRLPEERIGLGVITPNAKETNTPFSSNMRDSIRSFNRPMRYSLNSTRRLRNTSGSSSSFRNTLRSTSFTTRSSSLVRSLRTRSRPFYRNVSTRMRMANQWTNNIRRRLGFKGGGAPRFTRDRPRRSSAVSSTIYQQHPTYCSPSNSFRLSPGTSAKNRLLPKVRATRKAATAAREIRWEAASGFGALFECGATVSAALVRFCTAFAAMADAKLQQLRRSISSWSLSTVKKPKIYIPKLRTPSLNLFTGRKKNRVNPKDEETAAEDVKVSLLNLEKAQEDDTCTKDLDDKVGRTVIHEPKTTTDESQPTIVLTMHDHTGVNNLPPSSPNPGLLAPNDDIEYIDSDDDREDIRFRQGASNNADYNDHWFDCKGTLTRSREDLSKIPVDEDDKPQSICYETTDTNTKMMGNQPQCTNLEGMEKISTYPVSNKVDSDIPSNSVNAQTSKGDEEISIQNIKEPTGSGSHKARDWVKNLDDNTERRLEQLIEMQKVRNSTNIPKSKSEIRLDCLDESQDKWSSRNEIKLNAATVGDDEAYTQYLQKYNDKVECPTDASNKDDIVQKESLKRVFQVRGKLSNKTIIDSQQPSYKDTDIFIASAPFALTNSFEQNSHNVSEEGINCGSLDLDPALELGNQDTEAVQHTSDVTNTESNNSEPKSMTIVKSKETIVCQTTQIPNIVVDAPDNGSSFTEEDNCVALNITDNYHYSSSNTKHTGECSDHNATEFNVHDPKAQDCELYENDNLNNSRQEIYIENTENENVVNDSVTVDEKCIATDHQKPDRKKKKYSPNIPKSIKNIAGSIFSQQTDNKSRKGKIEEKETEKKRRSPFNKDYMYKKFTKSNTVGQSNIKHDSDVTNVSVTADKDRMPMNETNSDDLNPFINEDVKVIVPDLPSSESMKTGRGSSESLDYISPIESDEQKSISHESSPGFGNPFVEENGLFIRKEALLAVKSMENDDNSTHYYSFLSNSDDIQTAIKESDKTEGSIKGYVQPLPELSLFNEPPRNILSEKLKQVCDDTPSFTSEVSTINNDSESQATIICSLSNEAGDSKKTMLNSSIKEIPVVEKPVMKILEVEGHSPLCLPFPVSKEPIPTEVPKPKFAEDSQDQPPKPSPRTKKGRYGYSTASSTPTTPTAPINTLPIEDVSSPQNIKVSSNNNIPINETPKETLKNKGNSKTSHIQVTNIHTNRREIQRNSTDSGYNGPGNNYYESEPIYWEISETKGAPPHPSPRGKKGQCNLSEFSEKSLDISSIEPQPTISPTSTTMPVPSAEIISSTNANNILQDTQPVPEWINNRAPIPSPRSKKQRSLQSLPTVVPANETMETVKKRLQSMSSAPLCSFQPPLPQKSKRNKVEEQFYNGKAASISYGFTQSVSVPSQESSVPSPPARNKKVSQISLPGAMMVEDTLNMQQKRASLHEFGMTRNREKGIAPRPPSVRRSRRKTDPTQGLTNSAFLSAVQTEEHLCSVLYSIHSLMGGTGGGSWTVTGKDNSVSSKTSAGSNSDQKNTVTLAQVTKELQLAYQVTQETFDRLQAQAKDRPPIEVQLHLTVKEAKDLRPKTVKGKTNSYATVVIPSSGDSHRTRLQKNTLDPIWNQEFTLRVNNLQKDVVKLQIWHEHESMGAGLQQITAVKGLKSFTRLVKETTEQAKHQPAHLLGKIILPIKNMSEGGSDGWHQLEKDGDVGKDRGIVCVQGKVVSSAKIDQEGRRSFDTLLTRLIHHQLQIYTANNQESQCATPWNARLNAASTAALSQHAIMLGLNESQQHLSWWLVGSRVASVDASWLLSQLHHIQAALSKNEYNEQDLSEIGSSFSYFVRSHVEHLKDLHVAFPSTSGVLAQNQLTYTLKALNSLQTHKASRELLNQEKILHIHEMVTSSINTHAKNWWTLLVEEQLQGVKTADEQITRVIKIVEEANDFLNQATLFYNAAFMKEMNIPYMQTTYLMVSKKINPCVRPLLMNIYNRMPTMHDPDHEDQGDTNVQYALEVGTSLWQLYRNLGRLHKLGETLPPEARIESGVREYHRWFSRGVMRWLEIAICRALDMIKKAVELDNFTPVDAYCDFSSSATDTTGIFHDVKIWWLKLMWPDPEHSAVLLTRILADICSCSTTYSDLLRAKVDTMFQRDATDRIFITQQICIGLNNIERVRRELTGLPGHFGFDATLEEIRRLPFGEEAAEQLEGAVERLIISSTENMESKVNEFIETVISKMKPTLDRALQESLETQSESPLLEQVLDPAIQLLHTHLHTLNFQRFLWNLWEVLVSLFSETVSRNAERRRATYFGGVHDLLEASLEFFSPNEGIGLDREEACTKEYCTLLELLDSLRMSTESLISKYYKERFEEQDDSSSIAKAQLVVKMLFTRPGKLIVEVIMARDMITEGDNVSISSRGGNLHPSFLHSSNPVDSYVKVQLVPQEWFPSTAVRKTRTQRKADPAVYEETFEYDMTKADDGVRAGLLLFTLKDYNLGRSNTFIGEALVPLENLPCVDSSQVHTVSNTYLKMTTPGLDIGYKSLRALHLRTSDKMASSFLKKVSKRLTEVKGKGRSDDDRLRPRSPNLIDRFKFT